VQALRFLDDPLQRRQLAQDLAARGFQIDVPIMVWDWDPEMTMRLRQQAGYTWVPSALQNPVQIAPGLMCPGIDPYNPAARPPGAIVVSLDFV
jgi:hypothetical protein